jgi:benzoyl-CoA reductase/2-hydroxyglutaryl-CoA dehydratase subunit BcrC/BadD/HgdB
MISFTTCNKFLQLAHILPVEAHIDLLEEEISRALYYHSAQTTFAGVMISGITPPHRTLIEALESSGLRVVANDIAMLKRFYGYSPNPMEDPGEYYCDFYFNHSPCTTMLPSGDKRISHILQALHDSEAKGFIFFGEKFCEYEYLEAPYIDGILREKGVATLSLELGADNGEDLGALKNRIEAFAEMLKG